MKSFLTRAVAAVAVAGLLLGPRLAAGAIDAHAAVVAPAVFTPAVKKSVNNICHAGGTRYYAQTKRYTAYKTLKDCLRGGGRLPK